MNLRQDEMMRSLFVLLAGITEKQWPHASWTIGKELEGDVKSFHDANGVPLFAPNTNRLLGLDVKWTVGGAIHLTVGPTA